MKKPYPNPHYVVVDTNILRAKDDNTLTSPKLDSFLEEYGAEFQITLLVPEVVKGEIIYQQAKKAQAALNSAKANFEQLNEITSRSYRFRVTEANISPALNSNFDKWLSKSNGDILPTPTEKILWGDIVERSIWRKPPFEKDQRKGEKGFRDVLILETLRHYVEATDHDNPIAFICHDNLLRETVEHELKSAISLNIYESLENFESYLNLTRKNLEEQFIRNIVRKARTKFFKKNDSSCLYIRERIQEHLEETYKQYFEEPLLSDSSAKIDLTMSTESNWTKLTGGTFWVPAPQFTESNSKDYIWNTTITFVQQYYRQHEGLMPRIDRERILKLSFDVKWSARITDAARFMKTELVSMGLSDMSFAASSEQDRVDYNLNESS